MADSWSSEKLYFEGDDFFKDLLQEIASARASIDLETYIFDPDEIGRRVEKALVDASERGVHVRLLVDGIGASSWTEKRTSEFDRSKVSLRIYHPVFFSSSNSRRLLVRDLRNHPRERKFWDLLSRANRRDHRKIVLIDEKIAYVGSMNISSNHTSEFRKERAWRDTAIRVEGNDVAKIKEGFEDVWRRSHSATEKRRWLETIKIKGSIERELTPFVRFNHTKALRRKAARSLLERIASAKKRVWITNAYFAPSRAIQEALRKARENGAEVQLLLPSVSDVFFMPWVQRSQYPVLLKNHVQVSEYQSRFLHAKTVLIDDWVMIGSTNFNRRSFVHDFEVDIVSVNPTTVREIETAFINDLKESIPIVTARLTLKSLLGRWMSVLLKNWI